MMRSRPFFLSLPLLPLLASVFAAVAYATTDSVVSKSHNNNRHDRVLGEDGNGTETSYNPCSLCQGIDLLADKIPVSNFNPSKNTCAEMSAGFEDPSFIATGGPGLYVPQNATNNNAGSCRSDPVFNSIFNQCCRAPMTLFECDKHVHDYLFGGSGPYGEYNTAVPPIVSADQPLDVSVFLQFEALEEVEVEEGTATLFVTIVQKWNDPRLKWNITGNGTCSNSIQAFTGYDVETTTIWIPDFDLLNQIEGLQKMPNAKAMVFSDGTVVWNIKTRLKAICNYKGLGNIPFDTLGCQLLFGSPICSYLINYILETPEYFFVGVFDETYNKWTLVPELANQGYAINEQVIYYDFYFQRSVRHYVTNIMLPTVILTYLSFLTFLLDVRIGERLGFSVALTLVVVAQQIVTTDLTPISNQKLWLDKFVTYSFYFVLIGVIQSVVIAFLHFIRQDIEIKQERANTEATPNGTNEKELELQPLTTKKQVPENDTMAAVDSGRDLDSTAAVESGADSEINFNEEPHDEGTVPTGFHPKAIVNHIFFEIPLRKLDLISFCTSLLLYSVFLAAMVLVGKYDAWPGENPNWFNETSHASFLQTPFAIGNSRHR